MEKYNLQIKLGNGVEKCVCQHIGTVCGHQSGTHNNGGGPDHCAQSYAHNINFDNQQTANNINNNKYLQCGHENETGGQNL